jgi:hypothetical protein
MYRRITIVLCLSEQEMQLLKEKAISECRPLKYQIEYIIKQALQTYRTDAPHTEPTPPTKHTE